MKPRRIALIVAGILVVGAAGLAAFWFLKPESRQQHPAPDAGKRQAGEHEEYPRPLPDTVDPHKRLFRDCTEEVGLAFHMNTLPNEQRENFKINLYDHGCGLAVGDFDGDGRDDIYFANQLGANALYRNKGDGTFEDVTEKAGVGLGDRVSVAATFADYDNDGHQDLYVTSTRGGNVLFHNNGDGTFTDVTKKAGLEHVGHSQTAVFFDCDGDGFLDLFLTNTSRWTTDDYEEASHSFSGKRGLGPLAAGIAFSEKEDNIFYHNNGDGTFTDTTEKLGLKGRGWAGDAVAFDYDGDGRTDLFVTSMFGRAQLYHNRGGTFEDVTLAVLGRTSFGGTGARALDYNNDGLLDLFVVDMHSDMWMGLEYDHHTLPQVLKSMHKKFRHLMGPRADLDPLLVSTERTMSARAGIHLEEVVFGNTFYRNEGDGKFTEISDRIGAETFWPWGIAEGDFDNDGYQDAFIPSGMGYPFYYWPNALLMNDGKGAFHDRAEETGLEPPARGIVLPDRIGGRLAVRSSRCAAVADFDGDGRLEIVVNNFNDAPYFFKNEGPAKNYLALRLRGTRSNRDAIGAVVRLRRGSQVLTRQVHAAGGYLAQSSKTVHFGLGDQLDVSEIEIQWPSGVRQVLRGEEIHLNKLHTITEPAQSNITKTNARGERSPSAQ